MVGEYRPRLKGFLMRKKIIIYSLFQAFQAYDVEQAGSVTKGEFRRVIEAFCSPLTTDQFEAVLAKVLATPVLL